MQCPDCSGQLVSTANQGFNFLHCSSCHGKLIDEEILLRIETVTAAQASTSKQPAQADSREKLRNCPTCNVSMQKIAYGRLKPKTTIDKCPKCSYIWLGPISLLTRSFLSAYRPFEINLWDLQNNHILELKRPFRFYFHKMSIADGAEIKVGTIVREFSIINKKFSVLDGRGKQIMSIHGPLIRPWTFFVKRAEREIGKISKQWGGLLKEIYTDADTFGVKFNKDIDKNSKYILLGAVFLIDFLYFENNT